jgi:hypothetical protein
MKAIVQKNEQICFSPFCSKAAFPLERRSSYCDAISALAT